MARASILVVEDSRTQAERLRTLLSNMNGGHSVRVAVDGQEALELVEAQRPDLIISDIVMPRMDGFTMCQYLKNDPNHHSIPIMLLTSLSDPEDIIHGMNAGTDYYVTKPYDEEFLIEKVHSILRIPQGASQSGEQGWKVLFAGKEHVVHADLQQMINLLLSTYENAVQQNRKLMQVQEELRSANESLEERVAERTVELSQANTQLVVEIDERKRAQQNLQLQLQRIDALRHVEAAMSSSLDLRVFLNVLLDQTTRQLGVDAANVLLQKPMSLNLESAASLGLRSSREQAAAVATSGLAARAIRERATVHTEDTSAPYAFQMATPLIAKGQTLGVLEIFHTHVPTFNAEWVGYFETLARQAAIGIDSALLFESVQRTNMELFDAYDSTLEGWSRALDLRDKETEGHSLRVTAMSERLARRLNMSPLDMTHLRRGALLHDIGKLAVPDSILRKPEPLLQEEREIMMRHPFHAYEMLSPIAFLRGSLDIPYCHHEKWDGTGYPRGLRGAQIPLSARIFAVADVWDALRSERPYRSPWGRRQCLQHILNLSGSHFDPAVVEAFVDMFEKDPDGIDDLPEVEEINAQLD